MTAAGVVRFPLALAPAERALRPAAAWVVPGAAPADWVAEVAALARALEVRADALGLWVVPDPSGQALGLLVVPPSEARTARAGPSRAQPCGLAGERLLLPVDGRLEPEVAAAELDARLPGDPHLLHPVAGLVRLVPEARRTVLDLLAPPARVEGRFRALEPLVGPLRLVAVDVEDPPPLEAFLREGGAGVGEAPPSQAPPAPGEARGAGQWLGQQAARFVQWATGGPDEPKKEQVAPPAPAGAGDAQQPPAPPDQTGGGLVDRLRRWSQRRLAEVQGERERELNRLLHLLDTDPDEGLRYALPLKDEPGQAGRRPPTPSSLLAPRDVDYRPASARGGFADPWTIDPLMHRRLLERYREVANRELRLGRYRRAAYVFAELLGDLAAAASALEQGRHHREAAAIHRDHLGRPLEAARCLERGGLLLEAVAIYEAEGRHVEAGDLWGRLERPVEAERAYRQAVGARLAQNDPLSAARLLETKLDAVDEALAVLAGTWPDHPQAPLCLEDRLGLLGRAARHEQARRLLAELRQDPRRAGREQALARTLSAAATRYPEAGVQRRAADLVRVLAGERLPRAGALEAEALLQALARLDPGDRLLARDVGRLGAQRRRDAARARPAPTGPARSGWGPVVRDELKLPTPAGFSWRAAAVDGEAVWAAGVARGSGALPARLNVHRASWSPGVRQGATWSWTGQEPVMIAAPTVDGGPAIVAAGRQRLKPQTFVVHEDPLAVEVGTPGWLPDGLHAVAGSDQGIVWALAEVGSGLVLGSYDAADGGKLLGTVSVLAPDDTAVLPLDPSLLADAGDEAPPDGPLLVVGRDERALVAVGGELLRFDGTTPQAGWRLDRPARDLALLDRPFAAAVAHDDGGRVYFDDEHEPRRFGEGLASPRLAFTPDGLLLAISTDEGRVYEVGHGVVEHRGTFQGPGGEVLCVRPTGRARQAVVVMKSGLVRLMEVLRND